VATAGHHDTQNVMVNGKRRELRVKNEQNGRKKPAGKAPVRGL